MSRYKPIVLSADERERLRRLVRTGRSAARVITRARILLLTDDGQQAPDRDEVACQKLDCHLNTVRNVRGRYRKGGLDAALYDRKYERPPGKLAGKAEAQLALLACSDPPEGHLRWTLRLLADRMVELGHLESLSHTAVRTALKKTSSSLGRSHAGASAPRRLTL